MEKRSNEWRNELTTSNAGLPKDGLNKSNSQQQAYTKGLLSVGCFYFVVKKISPLENAIVAYYILQTALAINTGSLYQMMLTSVGQHSRMPQ
jgi:hypothetical protein